MLLRPLDDIVDMNFTFTETISRRPVFLVDYWPGVPGVEHEGREDLSWDLEHIKAHADPVAVRSIAMHLAGEPVESRAWLVVPDLLSAGETDLKAWRKRAAEIVEPLLAKYRAAGVQCVDLSCLFCCSGSDSSADWYKQLPDWEECTADGTPLSEAGKRSMACMFHPKMYEVLEKFWSCLSFLKGDEVLLGACIENEPSLGHKLLPDFGGHPYTQAAFRSFVAERFKKDVSKLNERAGTSYESFEQIGIGDDNWLVRALAARFKHTIILGQYLPKAASIAKKHLPSLVTITRLAPGYCWDKAHGDDDLGVEPTLLKDSSIDIIGWSHWHKDDGTGQQSGFGQFQLTCNLLRGTGKMLGITEPMVARHGATYLGLRNEEILHYIWRGLYFNFRMFNIHSWDRTGQKVHDSPMGLAFSQKVGFLPMIRNLRAQLDWISPYQTFGKPIMPPMRILVSRNARGYPGYPRAFYGDLLNKLCVCLERPELSFYEIVEEQSRDLDEGLGGAKGIVVVDACLDSQTTQGLEKHVADGGKLLVIGTPRRFGPAYESESIPAFYPIKAQADVDPASIQPAPVTTCSPIGHPIWPGPGPLIVSGASTVTPSERAKVVATNKKGQCVAAADSNAIYMGGVPSSPEQLSELLTNFTLWCGVEQTGVVISRFERATVAQNYDTRNIDSGGRVIDTTPWSGSLPLVGPCNGQIRELHGDFPWLAYHREGNEVVIESVALPPMDVKVFRKEQAAGLAHFEGLPEEIGFSRFWRGQVHLVIGKFTASRDVSVCARFNPGAHAPDAVGWFVCEVEGQRIAQGSGCAVAFSVKANREYYLTAVTREHPEQELCPLCRRSRFE